MGTEGKPTCSGIELGREVNSLGYRLNPIVAGGILQPRVFLVEGPSEIIFFRALAASVGIDLDREKPVNFFRGWRRLQTLRAFCCEALGISWVLRTDNDVFKRPKCERYRLVGVVAYAGSSNRSGRSLLETLWLRIRIH